MKTLEDAKKILMKNPEFKAEYERLDAEFKVLKALAKARTEANLTQAELADKMGVKQSAIARLERNSTDTKISTLFKFFEACGFNAELKLTPRT